MSTPLDKVRKLLALAADDAASEDEARTAAVLAARLMAEHGLVAAVEAPTRRDEVMPSQSGPTEGPDTIAMARQGRWLRVDFDLNDVRLETGPLATCRGDQWSVLVNRERFVAVCRAGLKGEEPAGVELAPGRVFTEVDASGMLFVVDLGATDHSVRLALPTRVLAWIVQRAELEHDVGRAARE